MTKKVFENKLLAELTLSEIACINPNIYWNERYIEYYTNYKTGNFAECWDFLMNNRHLLTIEHTPEKWKKYVKMNIDNLTE